MFPAKLAASLFSSALLLTPVLARDDGRYDHSPLKSWFESLQSEFGKCCTDVDGYIVSDADWESNSGRYRVASTTNGSTCLTTPSSRNQTASAVQWSGGITSTAIHASGASCLAA